jgi:hypothetical protein
MTGSDRFNNVLDGCQKRENVNDVMPKEKLVLSHYLWLGILLTKTINLLIGLRHRALINLK